MDLADLPPDVAQPLSIFVESAGKALGDDLVSVILFGSAAEARLRATSDVNVMLVLRRFDAARVDALREPLRLAHALIRLEAMFVLETEIADAAEAFAVKFADMATRHRVLSGRDVLSGLEPSRESMRLRLRQILLNYILRTRERYALVSLRDEQNAAIVADSAGPLRSAAEIILKLEGRAVSSPKLALEALARELGGDAWRDALEHLSTAREAGTLAQGVGAATVLRLIDLAEHLRARAAQLGQ